jgi:hypothetical protein
MERLAVGFEGYLRVKKPMKCIRELGGIREWQRITFRMFVMGYSLRN